MTIDNGPPDDLAIRTLLAEPGWGYLRRLPDRCLTSAEVNILLDEIDRLRAEVERAHLARIEAQNPGDRPGRGSTDDGHARRRKEFHDGF